ncbi:ribosomal protein S15 [Pseudoscourfieldia marina]
MSALRALLRRGALPARACAGCACACAYGGGGGVAAPASFQAPASIGWFSSAGGAHGGGGGRGFASSATTPNEPKAAQDAAPEERDGTEDEDEDEMTDTRGVELVDLVSSTAHLPRGAKMKLEREEFCKPFKRHDADCGSAGYQIAMQTKAIQQLTGHMKDHRQDKLALRMMQTRVNNRKRMMKYLRRDQPDEYARVITALGLRDVVKPNIVAQQRRDVDKKFNKPSKKKR